MIKKPVSKIIAYIAAVCTMVVMCGMPAVAFAWDGGITKEETVYVVTDSTGAQEDVIVSDHLVNKGKNKTIADETTLTDIENVKGEETFKQNGDALTWNAEGNSIYYQGKTTDEVPVTMDVVYRLNDRVVSGSELQGQTGKVEIKINYENNAEYEGTTVPFIVMTGLIVTDDSFQNVKITKGKVIDDGEKLLVVGMAAPGLAQTVGIGESELGIGSSVTITGDAKEFAVEDMMTIVTNAFFEDVDTDGIDLDYDDEIDALNKGAKALADGSDQLYKGLDTLADNMPTLKKGVKSLKDGAKALEEGTNGAKDGAKELNDGIVKLSSNLQTALKQILDGVTQLETGSIGLHGGLESIKSGVDNAQGGVDGLKENMADAGNMLIDTTQGAVAANNGAKAYINGAGQAMSGVKEQLETLYAAELLQIDEESFNQLIGALDDGMDAADTASGLIDSSTAIDQGVGATLTQPGTEENPTLVYGMTELSKGLLALSAGLGNDDTEGTLLNGANAISQGLGSMKASITNNLDSKSELSQGLAALNQGSASLADGEVQLAGGAKQLADGMTQLNDKADTMVNGVYQLDKGAYKLRNGMSKLYKEGIKKIVDMYNDDLKGTLDDLDRMLDAGKGYKTFTKLPSGMDGNVKFIYKTDMTK